MSDFYDKDIASYLQKADSRAIGRDYLPASAGGAGTGIVEYTTVSSGSASVLTLSRTTVFVKWTRPGKEKVFTVPHILIYVAGNILPSSAAGSANYRLEGPINTPYYIDGSAQEDYQFMTRFSVTNLTAGTVSLLYYVRARQIINKGGIGSVTSS